MTVNTVPTTMKPCKYCQKETPHYIKCGQGVTAFVCKSCLDRTLNHEQERE